MQQQSQSLMTIRDVKVKAGFAALSKMLPRFTMVSLALSGIAAAVIHLVFQLNVFTAFVVIFLTVIMLLGMQNQLEENHLELAVCHIYLAESYRRDGNIPAAREACEKATYISCCQTAWRRNFSQQLSWSNIFRQSIFMAEGSAWKFCGKACKESDSGVKLN